MHITLNVDERTLTEAGKAAEAMGKTLSEVLCEELEQLARHQARDEALREFLASGSLGGASGWRFDRDALHDRP